MEFYVGTTLKQLKFIGALEWIFEIGTYCISNIWCIKTPSKDICFEHATSLSH
jgi:hypothetical protein